MYSQWAPAAVKDNATVPTVATHFTVAHAVLASAGSNSVTRRQRVFCCMRRLLLSASPALSRAHEYLLWLLVAHSSTRSTHEEARGSEWSTESLCGEHRTNSEPWPQCVRWAEWSAESTADAVRRLLTTVATACNMAYNMASTLD